MIKNIIINKDICMKIIFFFFNKFIFIKIKPMCKKNSFLIYNYFFQNAGLKIIRTVNNSNLPINIRNPRNHFPPSGIV